jgi:hypothetical protein
MSWANKMACRFVAIAVLMGLLSSVSFAATQYDSIAKIPCGQTGEVEQPYQVDCPKCDDTNQICVGKTAYFYTIGESCQTMTLNKIQKYTNVSWSPFDSYRGDVGFTYTGIDAGKKTHFLSPGDLNTDIANDNETDYIFATMSQCLANHYGPQPTDPCALKGDVNVDGRCEDLTFQGKSCVSDSDCGGLTCAGTCQY